MARVYRWRCIDCGAICQGRYRKPHKRRCLEHALREQARWATAARHPLFARELAKLIDRFTTEAR